MDIWGQGGIFLAHLTNTIHLTNTATAVFEFKFLFRPWGTPDSLGDIHLVFYFLKGGVCFHRRKETLQSLSSLYGQCGCKHGGPILFPPTLPYETIELGNAGGMVSG